MKKLIFYILILALAQEFSFAQESHWRRLVDAETFEVVVNPKNPNTIFAGGGGRAIYRSYDGGENWDTLVVGFRMGGTKFNNLLINPVDTNIILVGGLLFGSLQRSTDNGETWELVLTNEGGNIALNGKAVLMQPDDPNVYYAGIYQTGDIYKSTDKGATWDSISHPKRYLLDSLATDYQKPFENPDTVFITSIGIRNDSTNIMFVNSTCGRLYMSTDYGVTWEYKQTFIYPVLVQGDCEITMMEFSPIDPLTGYAVITYLFHPDTNNGGVYKTTNGGYHWDRIGYLDTSFWAVAVREHEGRDEVFVGGYTSDYWNPKERVPGINLVFRSQDGGVTWYSYEGKINFLVDNPKVGPKGNVWSMRFFGEKGKEKLYMASEGGLFVLDNPSSVSDIQDKRHLSVNVSGGNVINYIYSRYSNTASSPIVFRLYDLRGRLIGESGPAGNGEIVSGTLNISSVPKGAYLCQVSEGNHYTVTKIVIE